MKKILGISLLLLSTLAKAQSIGFVYQDSIVQHAIGFIEKKNQYDSLQMIYSQEITNLRSQLEIKFSALTANYQPNEGETVEQLKLRMKPEDVQKMTMLEEENNLVEMRLNTYQKALEQNYNSGLKPILDIINQVIQSYAKKHKLDMVIIMEEFGKSLVYVNKSKNITQTIILLVNEQLKP